MSDVKLEIKKLGALPGTIANGEIVYVKDGPVIQQWVGDINGQPILVGTTLKSAKVSLYQPVDGESAILLYTPYAITITRIIGGIYAGGQADVQVFITNDLTDLQQILIADSSLDGGQSPNAATSFTINQNTVPNNYFVVVYIANAVQRVQVDELFVQMDYSFQNP